MWRLHCAVHESDESFRACLSLHPFDKLRASLKLARTIADLAGSEEVQSAHLAEALQYRPKLLYRTMCLILLLKVC